MTMKEIKKVWCDCSFHLDNHKNCIELCKCTPMTKKQHNISVQRTFAEMESRKFT